MMDKINAYFDDPARRQQLIDMISRLVAVKSVKGEAAEGAPFGPGPRAALDEGLKLCAEMGFKTRDYDHYVGLVDLNDKPDMQLHILGHLDVVGEGTGWDTDPYTCVEKDGMLYGRGVSDDKGPVCAALMAMEAVRELGLPVTKNARLILGTDEESGSEDIAHYYAREPFAPQAFTPDADFPVINIEKGHYRPTFAMKWHTCEDTPRVARLTGGFRANVVPPEATAEMIGIYKTGAEGFVAEIEAATGAKFTLKDTAAGVSIHCLGRNAHAASPEDGINAISALLMLLDKLPLCDCDCTRALKGLHHLFPYGDTAGKGLGIAMEDEESGALTCNFAILEVNALGLSGQLDCRYPLCATKENLADAAAAGFGKYGITPTGDMVAPHVVPADSELVQTLLKCYADYTGVKDPQPIAIGGGTYVHDIPGGVAFGCDFPGFDPKMHSANEQASVDNLILSAKIFTAAIAELLK